MKFNKNLIFFTTIISVLILLSILFIKNKNHRDQISSPVQILFKSFPKDALLDPAQLRYITKYHYIDARNPQLNSQKDRCK
jgi:hypothetical protein